jgi:hypothetical protein
MKRNEYFHRITHSFSNKKLEERYTRRMNKQGRKYSKRIGLSYFFIRIIVLIVSLKEYFSMDEDDPTRKFHRMMIYTCIAAACFWIVEIIIQIWAPLRILKGTAIILCLYFDISEFCATMQTENLPLM